MQATNKIACPECGKEIELVEKDNNPLRLVGYCNCKGARRAVIETDAQPNQKQIAVDTPQSFRRNKGVKNE
jgi:hypothetical protein